MLVQETISGSFGQGLATGIGEAAMTDEQISNIAQLLEGNATGVGDVAVAFDSMSKSDAKRLKLALIGLGVPGDLVDSAWIMSEHSALVPSKYMIAWGILSTASMAASAYHGWKRTGSWGWTLGWAFMGGMFPVLTPAVALAQGFGKPKK